MIRLPGVCKAISGPPSRQTTNRRRPAYPRQQAYRKQPACVMRLGPFLVRLVFANEKACRVQTCPASNVFPIVPRRPGLRNRFHTFDHLIKDTKNFIHRVHPLCVQLPYLPPKPPVIFQTGSTLVNNYGFYKLEFCDYCMVQAYMYICGRIALCLTVLF